MEEFWNTLAWASFIAFWAIGWLNPVAGVIVAIVGVGCKFASGAAHDRAYYRNAGIDRRAARAARRAARRDYIRRLEGG